MARPTKKTQQIEDKLVFAADAGGSMRTCAGYAQITVQTLYNWLAGDEDFAARFEEARCASELRQLIKLRDGDRAVDNRSVEAWLARTGKDYLHVDRRGVETADVDYDRLRQTLEVLKDA